MVALTTAHLLHLWLALSPIPVHSWYDGACCNDRDCREIDGRVLEKKEGYYLENYDTLIPYSDKRVRQSKDFDFHACFFMERGVETGIRCLYVPGRGT